MDHATPPPPPPAPNPPSSTPPPEPGPHDGGPRVTRSDVADLGRLRRTVDDRHVAGVAGGLARHLDIDPIIVRVALVVAALFGGAGVLLYAAGWILVPEEGTDAEPLGLDERSRSIALLGVGVVAVLAGLGDWAGAYWFPWPLALAAVVVVWFVGRRDRHRAPYDGSTGYGAAAPTGTAAAGAPAYQPQPSAPYHPGAPHHPGPPHQPHTQTYARPPRPRKRGPLLFWFTLALVALATGVLGVVDVAGAAVVPSAYPALALAITAAMLLLGSFWGRAGGLILVGLLATGALVTTLAVENVESERRVFTPTTASQVRGTYEIGAGELTLDLTRVRDVEALDGRTISIDVGAGDVEVIVPQDLAVDWTTDLGAGRVEAFGEVGEGIDPGVDGSVSRDPGDPEIDLQVSMLAGDITILESGAPR